MEREISCHDCSGLCCMNIQLSMHPEKAEFLIEGGTSLEDITPPGIIEAQRRFPDVPIIGGGNDLSNGKHLYLLLDECGFLSEPNDDGWRECGIYNDPRKPEICDGVSVGGKTCLEVKANRSQS